MADALITKQLAPTAGVLADLYRVPTSTAATLSTVMVCNRGASAASFNLAIALKGASDSVEQYLYYGQIVPAYQTFAATLGITLNASDVVRCYSTGLVSFNLFGVEID